MIGPVRQELLTGIRDPAAFEQLRTHLQFFDEEPLVTEDYEQAARINNACRTNGITGSPTDFLICAVAVLRDVPVFTADNDFTRYARHCAVRLHHPDKSA